MLPSPPYLLHVPMTSTWHRFIPTHPTCCLKVSKLVDLKTFLEMPENNPSGKTFKTMNDRKKFLKGQGLNIVKNPKDGSECVAVLDKVVMLAGLRKSASRVKEEQHESKEESKQAYAKAAESLQVQTNTRVQGSD